MSKPVAPLTHKDGVSRSRAMVWRIVNTVVMGGFGSAVMLVVRSRFMIDGMPFYSATSLVAFDRVMIFGWLLGLTMIGLSTYFSSRSTYPRTDAYHAAQLGFGLVMLSGVGFLLRLAAIHVRHNAGFPMPF